MPSMLPFLQAMTYADSAYPSGRYTLSHGLEGLVQARRVSGPSEVGAVLRDHLRHVAAPGDGVATACAARLLLDTVPVRDQADALDCLTDLDHELSATKLTGELRRASVRVGRQMLHVTADVEHRLGHSWPSLLSAYVEEVSARRTPGNQAVVAGLIHAWHDLLPEQAVATEFTGLAVGWAGAALRLRQCDHIDAQVIITAVHSIIAELAPHCDAAAVALLRTRQWRLLGRAGPGADLASAAHETAPARLFMN